MTLIRPKNQYFHHKSMVHIYINDKLIGGIKSNETKTIEIKDNSKINFKVGFVKSEPIFVDGKNKEIVIDFFMKIKSIKYVYIFIASMFLLPIFLLFLENTFQSISKIISFSLLALMSFGLIYYLVYMTVLNKKYFEIKIRNVT